MSDDSKDFERFGVVDGGKLADDDFATPGRSVFGDDVSFEGDDDVVPHWKEKPTGTVPQVGGSPSGSVIFEPADEPVLQEADPSELAAWSKASSSPGWADPQSDHEPVQPAAVGDVSTPTADAFFSDHDDTAGVGQFGTSAAPGAGADEQTLAAQLGGIASVPTGERDMPMAIVVGLALAATILAAMWVGPAVALVVVTVALGLGAVEFFNAVRVAGYQPAVLLGLTAIVMLPLAVYWRGEAAIALVLVLALVFGSLWYLMGVGTDGALRGLGVTMLGIVHLGVLGSFAALMLAIDTYGTGLLTAAILLTVAYDVGGLAIGRVMGRTPLSPASPNKTREGLVGGMIVTVIAAVVMGVLAMPAPIAGSAIEGSGLGTALLLGIVVAIVAPIGDLAESQLKRDIGIKDMGSILPGHGGLFDRFDGLLFALPTTYYVANVLLFT